MHRNRSLQNQLMFIFSAKYFTQMYRRLRFSREYAQYQRAQGEAVMLIQHEVAEAQDELNVTKRQKNTLLDRGEQEQKDLEGKQAEQQKVVSTLQKEQKTIKSRLAISLPIFAVTLIVLIYSVSDKEGFNLIWRFSRRSFTLRRLA